MQDREAFIAGFTPEAFDPIYQNSKLTAIIKSALIFSRAKL